MAEIDPGRSTSELGVLGLVSGLLVLNDELAALPGPVLYVIAALAAVYIVCRTWLKVQTVQKPTPLILGDKPE